MAKAKFYVTIVPEWGRTPPGKDHPGLDGIKAIALTQTPPRGGRRDPRGTVVVALTIEVPDGAFLPLRPEAVVVVPEGLTALSEPIRAEAVSPTDGAAP